MAQNRGPLFYKYTGPRERNMVKPLERANFVARRLTSRRAVRVPKIIETSCRSLEVQKTSGRECAAGGLDSRDTEKRSEMMYRGLRYLVCG